ncbi:hypothetical protein CE143_16085 [Photorhabdus luminescens]|uniref:CdiI immunity protein domain-containing protein n=2 Tax=Photorhabdus TaxID=29487 RepID=A0ABX8LVW4_9GAMM|nr:hypothetical protein [Photorhabdus akhurstii]KGM27305.1 hypothetical protein KS18_15640 [Photorhabdus luminescens]QXF34501.1 hypothetical protein B0X70_16095 [Photorhabdus akhurstii]UJD76326.1 hypothetical protein CE143_16085 [Photorhabdus luminescens]
MEDKDKSLRLSLSQYLPDGYLVWQDLIENSVGKFSLEDNYSEAEDYLEDIDEEYSDLQEEKTLIYRKSKIKEQIQNTMIFILKFLKRSLRYIKKGCIHTE